jgi:hypothetical protein
MTIQKLGLFSVAIAMCSFTACSSDNGTTPTASGVFPAQGFSGRSLRVEVSGDATKWKDGATISFGDGVTVTMVEVASPTDLFADITIDPAAMVGVRDVTVTSGGTFTLSQAFEVDAATTLTTTGTVAQGSVPFFTITNNDYETPFDSTSVADPLTGAVTFPNLAITAPSGVVAIVEEASPTSITGQLLINVTAGAGGPLTVASGDPAGTPVMSTTDSLAVAARTPVALTASLAQSTLANPYDTDLYTITLGDPNAFVELALPQPASDQSAAPVAFLIDSSGDLNAGFVTGAGVPGIYALLSDLTSETGTFYVIVQDQSGDAGYSYGIAGSSATLTIANEANDTSDNNVAGATAGTALPFEMDNGDLSSLGDVDYIKFTTGVVGQYVHVQTTDPLDATDSVVEVLDGATCTISLGVSSDFDYDEDFTSAALTTTTFCIKVTASPEAFDPSYSGYTARVWLQPFPG